MLQVNNRPKSISFPSAAGLSLTLTDLQSSHAVERTPHSRPYLKWRDSNVKAHHYNIFFVQLDLLSRLVYGLLY